VDLLQAGGRNEHLYWAGIRSASVGLRHAEPARGDVVDLEDDAAAVGRNPRVGGAQSEGEPSLLAALALVEVEVVIEIVGAPDVNGMKGQAAAVAGDGRPAGAIDQQLGAHLPGPGVEAA